MKKVIIIGTGGHAKVVFDGILKTDDKVIGFMDELSDKHTFMGLPVYHSFSELDKNCFYVVAIGNNKVRERFDAYNLNWYTFIHPTAVIAHDAIIKEGAMILPGVIINASAVIGKHAIINSGAIIEHDCNIGDYVHVSPHATICGTCNIGNKTWIGAGATIINNTNITSNVIIGAGSTVIKDVNKPGTYVGSPAHNIRVIVNE